MGTQQSHTQANVDEDDATPQIIKKSIENIQTSIPFTGQSNRTRTSTSTNYMTNINAPSTTTSTTTSTSTTNNNNYLTQDSVVNSVIEQFAKRSNVGVEKYGTTLDRTDLTMLDWIQHAQEELMDGILYLEKIKKTMNETQQFHA